ncbi:hypothetical protein MYMA111404_00200 [Mycoplasma marinum]|uniref:DUF3899 domain-containing protein n=1 Tax=Mycoplasma marinum TaxID=1937190 RepID=A0A4R0XXH0_9MOLU|nr:hypothetical protein [Mycoplasma marinum]TCG11724.1 hypothetical protein C4B24_01050 [Mycoplasma marinum]
MKKLFNKYDLGWFIVLFLAISITLMSMMLAHCSYKLISHVYFGLTIVGFCGILFSWISRKKDNAIYKKGNKKITDSDKRIIEHYTFSQKYNMDSFRQAKTRQAIRFLTIIILPTLVCFSISLIFAFI